MSQSSASAEIVIGVKILIGKSRRETSSFPVKESFSYCKFKSVHGKSFDETLNPITSQKPGVRTRGKLVVRKGDNLDQG